MRVVFDTNIWISFLLGKKLSILKDVLMREDIRVYVSDELLEEIIVVANRPKFKRIITAESLIALLEMVDAVCVRVDHYAKINSDVRDVDDIYLISMVETISADYLVTGDKDLLVLINQGQCKIITFAEFIKILEDMR